MELASSHLGKLDACFSRMTEESITTHIVGEWLREKFCNALTVVMRAGWDIYVDWRRWRFVLVNEMNRTASEDDFPLRLDMLRIVCQCAKLTAPLAPIPDVAEVGSDAANGAKSDTVEARFDVADETCSPVPMSRAYAYWSLGFDATVGLLRPRVEKAGGIFGCGMDRARPNGYFLYHRNPELEPETALEFGEEYNSGAAGVYVFTWEELQLFLDLLRNDERLLTL